MQEQYSLSEFLLTISNEMLNPGIWECRQEYPKMCSDVSDAIHKILYDNYGVGMWDDFDEHGKSEIVRLYRNWNDLLDQYFIGRHDIKTLNKLNNFKFPQLISTPFQYKYIHIVPLLTALDFYIEERRLRNNVIWNTLSCYMSGFYIFSVRVNNKSLSSLSVTTDKSNNVTLDEHDGRDLEEPEPDCTKAAEAFIAYLNEEVYEEKIILPEVNSDFSREYMDFMSNRMMKEIGVPEAILDGTVETKTDLMIQVLGNDTLENLIEQLKVHLKQKHKGKY